MRSRLLWRRSGAAAGLYLSVAFGIVAMVIAANELGTERFGAFAWALSAASFFQMLLDLTVEDSLTKYGFRYIEASEWGKLRRLFGLAVRLKLAGGVAAAVCIAALAPISDSLVGADVWPAVLAAAFLPLVQSPENVAGTALLLRGRYDLRGGYSAVSQALRLLGVIIGVQYGPWQAVLGMVTGQALATVGVSALGMAAFRRFPAGAPEPLGDDRHGIRSFVLASTIGTAVISLRSTVPPLILGVAAGKSDVGLLRIAQAPQTGLGAASSPVRLILLTEQTRAWEQGRESSVLTGIRRYMVVSAGLMAAAVPVFYVLMPWLVRTVFRDEAYEGAIDAARIILFAGALQVVFGWTKSFPTTIGRPRLRIVTHGIEAAVLVPLVAILGVSYGVTGAAVAMLIGTICFVSAWLVVLVRFRTERHAGRAVQST